MTRDLRALLHASDCWELFHRHPRWALAGAIAWAQYHPEHAAGAIAAGMLLTAMRRLV